MSTVVNFTADALHTAVIGTLAAFVLLFPLDPVVFSPPSPLESLLAGEGQGSVFDALVS